MIPAVSVFGGIYRLEIRRGLVSDSPYPDIFMFCDIDTGEVLAFFAPAPLWHSCVPARYASGLVKHGRDVDQYDAPPFLMEGVPFLRTYHDIFHGQMAHACVPVIGGSNALDRV